MVRRYESKFYPEAIEIYTVAIALRDDNDSYLYQNCHEEHSHIATILVVVVSFQALTDLYYKGLSKVEREPSFQSFSKLEFEFERQRIKKIGY
ncbi:Mitogen-activated protein (MAP) kinase, conserved site-containing protein [Artemisia annua]|uniref:Mitogen-activated protein (MAP) kinase, conserved site-containing protein n=1 Tax=Artemisia annua TaxID=35608 RepID=A0A2U1L644_ARTAN|nr:Mitogen-activated protein (MAP) kinase, conserved site-containing protein [Artemisia annua]